MHDERYAVLDAFDEYCAHSVNNGIVDLNITHTKPKLLSKKGFEITYNNDVVCYFEKMFIDGRIFKAVSSYDITSFGFIIPGDQYSGATTYRGAISDAKYAVDYDILNINLNRGLSEKPVGKKVGDHSTILIPVKCRVKLTRIFNVLDNNKLFWIQPNPPHSSLNIRPLDSKTLDRIAASVDKYILENGKDGVDGHYDLSSEVL